ncbi:MAG: tyrosine-type recombinase/integrase, partial [Bacteroidales bacterium]|nr:tyrosine-type recombinase/integrase [Bacteroidales bacterium]
MKNNDSITVQVTSPLFPGRVYITEMPNMESLKKVNLKKDGNPKKIVRNRKKGVKSEVYTFTAEDFRKILHYFIDRDEWLSYMLSIISFNTGRRNGDIMKLTWAHFFNPNTGEFRKDILAISEEKTDKFASPHINSAIKTAIKLYLEKVNYNPSISGYDRVISWQFTGTYKDRPMTYDGFRKALKRAAEAVGIEYNVGTHSCRKTFGKTARMIHPGDSDSMQVLQEIFNHSDTKVTSRYIGLTKEKIDKYYDDVGDFFDKYIIRGEKLDGFVENPIISLDVNDLREIISQVYRAGLNNSANSDPTVHIDATTFV